MPTAEQIRCKIRHEMIRDGSGAKHHHCFCPHCVESREHPQLHADRLRLRSVNRSIRVLRELSAEGVGVTLELSQRTIERRKIQESIADREALLEGREV